MQLRAGEPSAYLGFDDVIDGDAAGVATLAADLRRASLDEVSFARTAFEWVRDNIGHSYDVGDPRVTLAASEVIAEGVGLCYAKSHLLVALLRGGGVPAGLCYQRLGSPAEDWFLHGLVAVHLNGSWHRLDPRGNKPGIDAQFSVTNERLAYVPERARAEVDYPEVFVAPVNEVVAVLRTATDVLVADLPSGLTATG